MLLLSYLLEYNRYMNFFGIAAVLGVAWLCSRKKAAINFNLVVRALIVHFGIAFFVLKLSYGQKILSFISQMVGTLYQSADAGSSFIFGELANPAGPWAFVFAFKVLPIIIFFGAFMSVLFHLGIVQRCVGGMSKIMQPILGTSGAETLCTIANSFLGQTEAPLLVKNYLKTMTRSEFLLVMISGMATISGAILVVFAGMGVPINHLLASSVMSIPASILISKMLLPETEKKKAKNAKVTFESKTANIFDAIFVGTSDGLQLALNVAAMLISFLSLLALINFIFQYGAGYINSVLLLFNSSYQLPVVTVGSLFSFLFAPFGYLLGFTGYEALQVGQLLGTKVAVNELIAYGKMVDMGLSERTMSIATYVLCGFSNFSCIGIQIGGIGALVPERRQWLTELGLTAVLGGVLANLLSAMVVGLLI